MNFYEVSQQLKQLIQMNEMSKAFDYQNKGISVCAWVEEPMGIDNQYFKYYDNMHYNLSKKVARIRLDRPEYVGGFHKEFGKKKWLLTNSEKKELVDILKGPSYYHKGYTRWHDIIFTYNKDNFSLSAEDIINGNLDDSKRHPKMPLRIKPLPLDYPMPNYMELK